MNSLARSSTILIILFAALLGGCGGGGSKAPATITLQSIAISPSNPEFITLNATQQLTATATYSDGSTKDISSSVTWSSDTTSTVTVDASGIATSVANGLATISATDSTTAVTGSTSATVRVGAPVTANTVGIPATTGTSGTSGTSGSGSGSGTTTKVTLASVSITPANPSLYARGLTKQLGATATYSDGTTLDITQSVKWASDTATVATTDTAGLVTSVDGGTSNISATDAATSLVGSATFTVAPGTAPAAMAVDPSGKFAYTVNRSSNDVSVFSIDTATGNLTKLGQSVPAGTDPVAISLIKIGTLTFAYIANSGSNNISAYSVNPTTGALTELAGSPFAAGTAGNPASAPWSITVTPDGKYAYVANFGESNPTTGAAGSKDIFAHAINASTGVLTAAAKVAPLGTSLANPWSVSVDPTSSYLYVADKTNNKVYAYSISSTGKLAEIAATTAGAGSLFVTTATIGSNNFAYVANLSANSISPYSISAASGTLSAAGSAVAVAGASGPWSIAIDPTSKFAYAANWTSNNVSVYSIIQATGALTAGSAVAAGNTPHSVVVEPSGKFAYVANWGSDDIYIYSIDAATGALTYIGKAGV